MKKIILLTAITIFAISSSFAFTLPQQTAKTNGADWDNLTIRDDESGDYEDVFIDNLTNSLSYVLEVRSFGMAKVEAEFGKDKNGSLIYETVQKEILDIQQEGKTIYKIGNISAQDDTYRLCWIKIYAEVDRLNYGYYCYASSRVEW
jgi:hypothetical protein